MAKTKIEETQLCNSGGAQIPVHDDCRRILQFTIHSWNYFNLNTSEQIQAGICYFVKADIVGQFHLHILAQLTNSVLALPHDHEVCVCVSDGPHVRIWPFWEILSVKL